MEKTVTDLESFQFIFDENIISLKTTCGQKIYCLCAWYFRNLSSERTRSLSRFRTVFNLEIDSHHACFSTNSPYLWDISLSKHSGKIQSSETLLRLQSPNDKYKFCSMNIEDGDFQELQNSSGIIICRMARYKVKNLPNVCSNVSGTRLKYLKSLEADLKNYPSDFSKEKVSLQVGKEKQIVNKAVLCARSPVFAKMFDTDMKEQKNNSVTITDIPMRAIETLVSFLYNGFLPEGDFHFLTCVYDAAIKYDIRELREVIARSMLSKMTLQNVIEILKFSSFYSDDLLMSAAMTVVSANIEALALTLPWKNLMCDDPQLALKASTFFLTSPPFY